MPTSGPRVQEGVLLLPHHHLHPLLHACNRILGQFLARSEFGARQSVSGSYHPPHYGYSDVWYQPVLASRLIYEGEHLLLHQVTHIDKLLSIYNIDPIEYTTYIVHKYKLTL